MAMKSKYDSRCADCGNPIRKDIDWIEPKDVPGKGRKWCHVKCPTRDQSALGTSVKTFGNYQSGSNDRGKKFASINNPLPIEEDISDAIAGAIEQSLLSDEPIVEKTFVPSVYQQAIFDEIVKMGEGTADSQHLVVEAVAGSGKSTTIKQSLKLIPADKKTLFVAFNKHIAEPLNVWLNSQHIDHVKAGTLHSTGLSDFKKSYPNFQINRDLEENKVSYILEDYFPVTKKALQENRITKEQRKINYIKRDGMRRIVSMAKSCLIDCANFQDVFDMIDHYNIDIDLKYIDELVTLLPTVMQRCKEQTDKIDFDDMIWLPIVLNLTLEQYNYIMVDEAQDLNKLQIEFILRAIKTDGHIIAVGDRYQSLYAFRGADAQAIPNIIKMLNAKTLPLSVTYRCPLSHVKKAQELVPQLEARENAPEGTLNEVDYYDLPKVLSPGSETTPGDMVICRTNGPLVKPAFECIRRGKKAVIRGKEIGDDLTNLVKRFETNDITLFVANLSEWFEAEFTKLVDHGKEMKAVLLQDKYQTLMFIANECKTVIDLNAKITMLFGNQTTGIIFSSIHKAKGLEAERVFILRPDLMPHPRASQEWEVQQELNCKYVAETRSKDTLTYVLGGENV